MNRSTVANRDEARQGMWSGLSRIAFYISLLIIPLLLLTALRAKTDHGFVYELGKNFALLGFLILALQFLLSARVKWIEGPFGQDILLHFHKWMAVFATSLLLLHPLLLAAGGKGWSLLTALDSPWYMRAAILFSSPCGRSGPEYWLRRSSRIFTIECCAPSGSAVSRFPLVHLGG